MVLKACHLHLQQGCVNKGSLNPSSPLALPSHYLLKRRVQVGCPGGQWWSWEGTQYKEGRDLIWPQLL